MNKDNLLILQELPCECDLNCSYCFATSRKTFTPEMQKYDISHFREFYDQFDPKKTIVWFCSFGEPTLYPGFVRILGYFFKRKIPVGITCSLINSSLFI